MLQWTSRCLPGFSILALLVLLARTSNSIWTGSQDLSLSMAQQIFMVYTLLVHTNLLVFALRLSCSLWYTLRQTKQVLSRRYNNNPIASPFREPASPTQKLPHPTVFEVEDEVVHAIILPNYGEDLHTLRTTLNVLASHPRASTQYEVYLAMEQKESDAHEKAAKLLTAFEDSFLDIQSTFHPCNLPGEIAGKSSNVAFAARHIVQVHRAELSASNVIVTVMDADTHLWQDYFTEIRRLHYAHEDADRTLYACPIIFDRNSHESPILVRCADLLWGFAGLSTMYPGSAITIPTSVYSLPLSLAEKVGGWDSDPTAIGEDMHMLLKCYFETAGNLVSRVVHVPASQCNVSGDEPSGTKPSSYRKTLSTYQARYRQALRHMWGALDSGFATRRTLSYLRLHSRCLFLRPRHLALLHLLWEAHFLPVHLFILMIFSAFYEMAASTTFSSSTHALNLHQAMRTVFLITGIMRTVSFLWMNGCLMLYERWHAVCLDARQGDMLRAGVADTGFAKREWWKGQFLLERICFPIAGTVFGAVPTLHAVFAHFWTDRLVYRVSRKPDFQVSVNRTVHMV